MMIAQKLYENGRITYMRTDSVNLAESALAQTKQVVSGGVRCRVCARGAAPLHHEKQGRTGGARSHPTNRPFIARRPLSRR